MHQSIELTISTDDFLANKRITRLQTNGCFTGIGLVWWHLASLVSVGYPDVEPHHRNDPCLF